MKVGCLGDIVFEVSAGVIKTVRDVSISGSANYQKHQRHLDKELLEFVGSESDSITLSVRISKQLGVDPIKELEKISKYIKEGKSVLLTLGTRSYGKWVITKHKTKYEFFDKYGNVICADTTLTLSEYVKG